MSLRLLLVNLFTLVLCVLPCVLTAQYTEKEPLYFQSYTIEDGLADNWIRSIAQDEQGFLWIATQSGVNRFDGYEFETFRNNQSDTTTISNNETEDVLIDKYNNVWVASVDGVDLFDRSTGSFKRLLRLESAVSDFLSNFKSLTLFEAKNGSVWIGSTNGLSRFDSLSQSFQTVDIDSVSELVPNRREVTSITESEDGKLWIGTLGNGIIILDPETDDISYMRHDPNDPESLPNDNIFNLFIDRDQVLWVNYDRREGFFESFPMDIEVGAESGLWKKDLRNDTIYHYKYDPELGHPFWALATEMYQTNDGKLWLTNAGDLSAGFNQYSHLDDSFFRFQYDANNPGSLPWNFTTSIFEDDFGHLWVGTSRGLARADRQQVQMTAFTPVPGNRYDLTNNLYGIQEMEDNIFWISRDTGPGIFWDRNTDTWRELQDINTNALPVSYEGGQYAYLLWNNNIERINVETLQKRVYETDSSDGFEAQINHFLKLSDELILVGTSEGLSSLNPSNGRTEKIDLPLPFSVDNEPNVAYLSADSTGKIWLVINDQQLGASESDRGVLIGSYSIESGGFESVSIDNAYRASMGGGVANHLFIDSRGDMWISKTTGLVRYNPKTGVFRRYSEDDGLRYLFVLGTLEDDQGMIWVSTQNGISRLNPDTNTIKNYGRDEGLRPSRLNRFSFFKRENGELMFGGVGGISIFHPDNAVESIQPPLIQIVGFDAGETTINLTAASGDGNTPDIEWRTNSINLEYISVNFRNPDETTYQYRLDGLNEEWTDAGNRRFAQFSNLPPADYTFQVKAIDANGVESAQAATVTFSVLPPWYRTWWAYGIYSLLFIFVAVAINRVQRKRVQQKEREKAREKELEQAREIEKAYENLKAAKEQLVQQEKLASLGQLTAGIAHEIKNPLNFVNNFSELSVELVEEAREEVRREEIRLKAEDHGREKKSLRQPAESTDPSVDGEVGDVKGSDDTTNLLLDILDDIEINLKTIHKHGTRADGIVKSMLQHSRGGDGTMEPTALNPLIKEYVNLAFHGMRAGKEPINVDIDLQLDESVSEVPLVAEDFSRVILNLVNNAFDAMREKGSDKDLTGFQNLSGLDDYQPKLTVRTLQKGDSVTIEIQDNGPGIPEGMKDKILQPFFTTKKGTAGTGLGLSITNDIVKAHGGQLDVNSKPGQTVFTIKLNA